MDEVGKATLGKLYSVFPETKSFEIINASNVQSDVSVDLSEIARIYTPIVKSNKRPVSLAYRKPAIFRSHGA
ncbi:hypothetical protein HMPREF0083_00783 [Aneurinibacillus aneurinilyticus ATCC 12856]|uniref:Uncharacterized protein n=1 Tax=Aneurinibacillus aneurinilyticus ATCC 12856 TaxID=649747 RepID=U1WR60_ANEAE|nr:hypothetical protein HMPREF0083_00783 [Aneurinibacillus aneurinilyticus ATCC 12856]